jgi:ubiquinone/menaquinone biosynthesis C-methylase UbiE
LGEGHHFAHDKARRAIVSGLRGLGATSGWTILSIGTGDGYEIPLIEQVSRRIVGVDLALVALRKFRAHFPYPVFQGNVRQLPFRDQAFNACVVAGLLHHIVGHDDVVPYLVEFRRVLRTGGALVVVEPNSLYPVQWFLGPINRAVQRVRPGWRGLVPHERPISPGLITRWMREAGYQALRYVGTTFLHNRMPAALCRLIGPMEDRILDKCCFRQFAWWTMVTGRRGPM